MPSPVGGYLFSTKSGGGGGGGEYPNIRGYPWPPALNSLMFNLMIDKYEQSNICELIQSQSSNKTTMEVYEGSHTSDKCSFLIAIKVKAVSPVRIICSNGLNLDVWKAACLKIVTNSFVHIDISAHLSFNISCLPHPSTIHKTDTDVNSE